VSIGVKGESDGEWRNLRFGQEFKGVCGWLGQPLLSYVMTWEKAYVDCLLGRKSVKRDTTRALHRSQS